jgi:hypothetical protein
MVFVGLAALRLQGALDSGGIFRLVLIIEWRHGHIT